MGNEYDPYSAITFLLLGLGIGTVLALVCNPKTRQRVGLDGINNGCTPGAQRSEWCETAGLDVTAVHDLGSLAGVLPHFNFWQARRSP